MNWEPLEFAICPKPIFIIGSPRSGTSILPWSLAQHSELWTSHESEILFTLLGNRHAEKAFQAAIGRPDETWLLRHGVGQAEFLHYLGLGLNALFSSRSQGKRWIDQTPLYTLMVDTLADLFPGAVFLHVLRDGRRVVHSMINFCNLLSDDLKSRFTTTGRLPGWATNFRDACKTWRRFVEVSMDFCTRHPDRCLTIRNEDLLANTDRGFSEIFRFLGVPYQEEPITYFRSHRLNTSFPHLDPDKPPALQRRPDPWRQWTTEQKNIFVQEAGETLVKYGLATEDELTIAGGNGSQELMDSSATYSQLVGRIREMVQNKVPAQARVLVVSKGDDRLLELGERQARHFPQDEAGIYPGYYPADSTAAIAHLEALLAKGADYLLFPSTAFWWLEHYGDLHHHLETRHRRIWDDRSCIIYQLSQTQPGRKET